MGTYTELVFACELKDDVPQQVIDILNYAVDQDKYPEPTNLPDHSLFKYGSPTLPTWRSAYFPGEPAVGFLENKRLTIRSQIKSYGDYFIEFLHWIAPYLEHYNAKFTFLGYVRPDTILHPKLIYLCNDGQIYLNRAYVLEPIDLDSWDYEDW